MPRQAVERFAPNKGQGWHLQAAFLNLFLDMGERKIPAPKRGRQVRDALAELAVAPGAGAPEDGGAVHGHERAGISGKTPLAFDQKKRYQQNAGDAESDGQNYFVQ